MDSKSDDDEADKICRYCLDGKNSIDLISPCDCQGTSKYVHQDCLAQWIKTKHASSLRINILQNGSIIRTLPCTECRGDYQIRISPVSWNRFFYRLLFDVSNQKLLQKMGLQIAWILFQSTTLSLVSKAFIKSINQFGQINNIQNVSNLNGFSNLFRQFIKGIIYSLTKMQINIKSFFYNLFHPLLWIKKIIFSIIAWIKYYTLNIFECIINPIKIIKFLFYYIRKFILFIRVTFLFILIVQHTASITFNASKLYQAFKKHKVNLVRLEILEQNNEN